ncbi:hypothetical protein ACFOQM_16130, partial [Paenibacillus sp. GCM10012307]
MTELFLREHKFSSLKKILENLELSKLIKLDNFDKTKGQFYSVLKTEQKDLATTNPTLVSPLKTPRSVYDDNIFEEQVESLNPQIQMIEKQYKFKKNKNYDLPSNYVESNPIKERALDRYEIFGEVYEHATFTYEYFIETETYTFFEDNEILNVFNKEHLINTSIDGLYKKILHDTMHEHNIPDVNVTDDQNGVTQAKNFFDTNNLFRTETANFILRIGNINEDIGFFNFLDTTKEFLFEKISFIFDHYILGINKRQNLLSNTSFLNQS